MVRRIVFAAILVLMFPVSVHTGHAHVPFDLAGISAEPEQPPFLKADSAWVDSMMATMTLEEKIAQMVMVRAYSNKNQAHVDALVHLVTRYKIGGVIFFQGDPVNQAKITNQLQSKSKIPLLVALDAEWGAGMRLDNTLSYPRQMELGAISDNRLIFQMGQEIARQLKEIGVHMNFAPVADINNNPRNPVINTRSFGDSRENVSEKVIAYFQGMQQERLLVTAKHFPGHGDTHVDSHVGLPVINFSRERIDSLELFPFKEAIKRGLTGIMVAHLHIPALDDRENRPSTLSAPTVEELLKKELGFQGLIVTDALDMEGAKQQFKPGELDVEAVIAGNDILLIPSVVPRLITAVKRAVKRGQIPEERIDFSCRKILLAKSWLGEEAFAPIETNGLVDRLHDPHYKPLMEELAREAQTLLKNRDSVIPFRDLDRMQLAVLHMGSGEPTPFAEQLNLYMEGDHFYFPSPADLPHDTVLNKMLSHYNTVVVGTYYNRSYGNNYNIPAGVKEFLNGLEVEGSITLVHFGYPYSLGVLGSLDNMDALLLGYHDRSLNQRAAASALFGANPISGRLPVAVGDRFATGAGIAVDSLQRLKYSAATSVGMNPDTLELIDLIVQEALRAKAMPGCQVLVARKGNVVWNKSYGFHTFRNRIPVKNSDLYDIASITKIASTIPSLMRLQGEGRFELDTTLGFYFPELDTTNKRDLKIRDILTHQAGLVAWIPFYIQTLEPLDTSEQVFNTRWSNTYSYKMGPAAYANLNTVRRDSIYSDTFSVAYPYRVANNLFMRADYRDSIYATIQASKLNGPTYKYSDLGYYYFYRAVEKITDTLFYSYNWFNFYGPLGSNTLGFLPLNRFDRSRIVPTENDVLFRKQLIHGDVHDPGAAMLGGICGHAGLFSNANDLAKLMQVYLNHGSYGGERLLDSALIAEYTREQFPENDNRRGLGFDRPVLDRDDYGPVCDEASAVSFGHSGFTGTLAWMDPEEDLLYIFLSNRIHPNQRNAKLITMDVRTRIQSVLYRSIEDK